MANLSITLPEPIVKASNDAAKKLGLSRAAFIRQAVVHELNNFQIQSEQADIIKSFDAMKKSKKYLQDIQEITEGLNSELPRERSKWWAKTKY